MHYLYILHCSSLNRFYIGVTDDVKNRLFKHNSHIYKSAFTKIASDWKVVLEKKYNFRNEAVYIEKFIKRMKSKKFIEKIINNPKILDDILSKRNL